MQFEKFEQHYDRFLEIAQDGVLIRNCESFQFLKQHGFDRTILLDHNLYVFNQYSRQFWKRNGVELFTAPMELNAEELNVLGLEESELVIYGRIPVMTFCAVCGEDNKRLYTPPGHDNTDGSQRKNSSR
mgnify:CR=1 FL=1